MKQTTAMTKLMRLWDANKKASYMIAEEQYGKQSYERVDYGSSYATVDGGICNENEVNDRYEDMIKDDFSDFCDTYKDEICQAMMPDYEHLLDDDMPDAVDNYVFNLTFEDFIKMLGE